MSQKEREIWDQAVIAVLREVNYYDGVIPDQQERDEMIQAIFAKVAYKNAILPKFKYQS